MVDNSDDQTPASPDTAQSRAASVPALTVMALIVATFLAGPAWYLWRCHHTFAGGILLGVTALAVFALVGMAGPLVRAIIPFIVGNVWARVVFEGLSQMLAIAR